MRPLLYAGLLILVLFLAKTFFFSSDDKKSSSKKGEAQNGAMNKPQKLNTIIVSENNSDQIIFSSGSTTANEEVELRSEVSGKIVKLLINEGSNVQKGQLIAKIKDDDILAQLKKIEVDEKLANQIEARQKKLLDINAISKEEYEISQNKVISLNAEKEILKVQWAKTEIRAPFSGKIGLKSISVGAYVTPATTIATVIQYNPIKVDFTIPEKYLGSIKLGNSINFQTDGSIQNIQAKVIAIEPKVDPILRTLKVRAVANNAGSALYPGMFVKVLLNLKSDRSIMIPSESIVPVIDGKVVYLKRNGVAEEVKVETGLRNEKNVQVLSGLKVGDTLIVSGLMTLKVGSPVISKN